MTELIAYFNGEFVLESQCLIHATDRGFRTGDVVYDLERTFDGKLFRLREHMDRFARSLKYARLDPGLSVDEFEELTLEVLRRNEPLRDPGGDFNITQFVTRGRASHVLDSVQPTVCILPQRIDFSQFGRYYEEGVHVVFSRTRSYSTDSLDPKLKHYSRMNFVLASLEVADVDPEAQPVLLDGDGNIAEHIVGNIFLVSDGVLKTPGDRNILQGETRRTIAELARRLDIPYVEESLQPYDVYNADEVFLTNTQYCILPAGRVDNRTIGEEVPGPVTRRIQAAFSEMVGIDFVGQALSQGQPSAS